MRPLVSVFYTGTSPNLIGDDVLEHSCLNSVHRCDIRDSRGESDTKLMVYGAITLHLCMGKSHTSRNFGVLDEFFVHFLLASRYIDKFLKLISPEKRKIVSHHSPSVPIFMVQKVKSETEKSNKQAY